MGYFLFAGIAHSGGMDDYRGGFDNLDDAKAAIDPNWDWAHIATVVGSTYSEPYGLRTVCRYTKRDGWIDVTEG